MFNKFILNPNYAALRERPKIKDFSDSKSHCHASLRERPKIKDFSDSKSHLEMGFAITTIFIIIFLYNIHNIKAKEINIDVNGLVCEFCAVTMEKNFNKQPEVKNVKIDLQQKKIFLTFNAQQDLSDDKITNVVKNNGYNIVRINR